MFGYIYLVRNKINGKQYIGQKHSDHFISDYLGSGVYLKRAVNKYGRENFEHVKILQECDSKEELDQAERYWIDFYSAVESPDFYNLAKGGVGTTAGSKRSDSWKAKISEKTRHRVWRPESRKKISDYVSGRLWMTDGVDSKQVLPDEVKEYMLKGWRYGRPSASEDARRKMSKAKKGHCYLSEEFLEKKSVEMTGEGNPFYGKTHSDEQKAKWSVTRREMVWVNKNGKNTVIHYSRLQEYVEDGWTRGMVRKKKSSTTIESIAE